MSKLICPLGDDCDITIAWMKGAEDARDRERVRIAVLTEYLEAARRDAKEAKAYAEELEAKLAKAVERLTAMRDDRVGYRHVSHYRRGATVTLAEIEGDKT